MLHHNSRPASAGGRNAPPPPLPCTFPRCDCPGKKVHRGGKEIAERIWGDPDLYRRVFSTKGLPVAAIGTTLHMYECQWIAYLRNKSREK